MATKKLDDFSWEVRGSYRRAYVTISLDEITGGLFRVTDENGVKIIVTADKDRALDYAELWANGLDEPYV